MQDQPINKIVIIEAAYMRVEFLQTSLKFIEACFNFLPYRKLTPLSFSLTYYYSETLEFSNIDGIINELKRCINYQVERGQEISIPAEINLTQKVQIDGDEVDFFYYGNLKFFDIGGFIFYRWYRSTPVIQVDLFEPTTGEMILTLFKNFQEAITDQINKNK